MPAENLQTRRQVYPSGMGLNNEAELGRYLRVLSTQASPGTGIAAALTQAFSATAAFLALSNTDANKRATIDYIKLVCTVPPASATAMHAIVAVDNINRFSSGGTTLVPQNSASDTPNTSILTVNAGAVVAAAASAVRYLNYVQLRTVIPVVGDTFTIAFGEEGASPATVLNGTNPSAISMASGPLVIGPGHSALLHVWYPAVAVTPASFVVEVGWMERG